MIQKLLYQRVTKRNLMEKLGVGEREARRIIKSLAEQKPVISLSDVDKQGYKLAMSRDDYSEAKRAMQELRSRRNEIYKREKQLSRFCQMVESGATDSELHNHYQY